MNDMNKTSKIYVAGHQGMVGSAIIRQLKSNGYNNIVVITTKDLNLINQKQVQDFFTSE